MTLQEFLGYLGAHPGAIASYFAGLPLFAWIIGAIDNDRGHVAPWNYLYSGIVYLSSVPGIFVLALNVYLFLFERRSIMDMDLIAQVLPVLSMILCLAIIRRNVDLAYVPGFEKLSGLLLLLTSVIALMWLADRTQVIAFVRMRFEAVVVVFLIIFIAMRWGARRLLGPPRSGNGQ
jgi:hypothetical protein